MKHTFYDCALCENQFESKKLVRGFKISTDPQGETIRELVSPDNKNTNKHICCGCAGAVKNSIAFMTKEA